MGPGSSQQQHQQQQHRAKAQWVILQQAQTGFHTAAHLVSSKRSSLQGQALGQLATWHIHEHVKYIYIFMFIYLKIVL